jgi:hypothetical protein
VEAEARRKVLEMGVVSWRCGKPVLDGGPLVRVSTGWVGPGWEIDPRFGGYSVCGYQVVWHRLTGAFLGCNHIAVPQVDGVNY